MFTILVICFYSFSVNNILITREPGVVPACQDTFRMQRVGNESASERASGGEVNETTFHLRKLLHKSAIVRGVRDDTRRAHAAKAHNRLRFCHSERLELIRGAAKRTVSMVFRGFFSHCKSVVVATPV